MYHFYVWFFRIFLLMFHDLHFLVRSSFLVCCKDCGVFFIFLFLVFLFFILIHLEVQITIYRVQYVITSEECVHTFWFFICELFFLFADSKGERVVWREVRRSPGCCHSFVISVSFFWPRSSRHRTKAWSRRKMLTLILYKFAFPWCTYLSTCTCRTFL